MKEILSVLLTVLVLSCSDKQSKRQPAALVSYPTEIDIELVGYEPKADANFATIFVEDGIYPIEEQLKISDSGKIHYVFGTERKREIRLKVASRAITLIVSPKEKLAARLDYRQVADWEPLIGFEISGANAKTNSLLLKHTNTFEKMVSLNASDMHKPKLSVSEYDEVRAKRFEEQSGILDSIIEKDRIADATFKDWALANLRYSAACDMLGQYKINKEKVSMQDHIANVKEFVGDSEDQITYFSYLDYWRSLSSQYVYGVNTSKDYKAERAKMPKRENPNFPIMFDLLASEENQHERNLLVGYLFAIHDKLPIPQEYLDKLREVVPTKMADQILSHRQSESNESIVSLIEKYDMSQKEKDELKAIYKEADGKPIFLDIWITPCAPCIKAMPKFNSLMEKVGNDAFFVFFGADDQKELWEKTRAKYKLKGRHHYLSKNQIAFFQKYFGFNAYPKYQVVDADGKIANVAMPWIDEKNFDAIHEILKKNGKASGNEKLVKP